MNFAASFAKLQRQEFARLADANDAGFSLTVRGSSA
jgi:hypothetical protein